MALQDIAQVSVSLETSGVSQAGFGTPIFIGAHRWTRERVRSYSSMTDVAADMPATSKEYKGLQQLLSQTPRPSTVKLGRMTANTVVTPGTPAEGDVFSIVVKDGLGASVTASYTAASGNDQEDIVDGLKADIDASVAISAIVTATKSGTGASAILTIAPVSSSNFEIGTTSSNLTVTFTTSETAAQVMSAITAVDDDFYFVSAYTHSETFVLGMAADVEARQKMYFVSTQETAALTTLTATPSDVLGKLAVAAYARTVGMFAADADTTYPECAMISRYAPYTPGTFVLANKVITGVGGATDPATGLYLSTTQKNNLSARNVNFMERMGGNNILREGKVVGNEWIDVIRDRDYIVAKLTEAYQFKLMNSAKITYTDVGINSMRGVGESTLNRFVSTETFPNILRENEPFVMTFPKAADVSAEVKASRVLVGTFVAYLAGAIHITQINGTLSLATE